MIKCSDNDFVQSYFQSSRLHMLSEMKNAAIDKVAGLIENLKIDSMYNESLRRSPKARLFAHVDLDCFFVSASLLNRPDLVDKPVAISYATSVTSSGASDISTCNYIARSYGLKSGMWVRAAYEKCPNLVLLPYDFDQYKTISALFYDALLHFTKYIEPVSCDEAFLDITDLVGEEEITQVLKRIRHRVFEIAGIQCSVGCSYAIDTARIATKYAKPDNSKEGVFVIPNQRQFRTITSKSDVRVLPGVGPAMERVLKGMGITTIRALSQGSIHILKRRLGSQRGTSILELANGRSTKGLMLGGHRFGKSISVNLNWGVRFTDNQSKIDFVSKLTDEVLQRLRTRKQSPQHLTLAFHVRQPDANKDPAKYMGMGRVYPIRQHKNITTGDDIKDITLDLCRKSDDLFDVNDLRGVSITLGKLQGREFSKRSILYTRNTLDNFLRPLSPGESVAPPVKEDIKKEEDDDDIIITQKKKRSAHKVKSMSTFRLESKRQRVAVRPKGFDMDVWDALPTKMRWEAARAYDRFQKNGIEQPVLAVTPIRAATPSIRVTGSVFSREKRRFDELKNHYETDDLINLFSALVSRIDIKAQAPFVYRYFEFVMKNGSIDELFIIIEATKPILPCVAQQLQQLLAFNYGISE
ncbi:hypothetical protein PCE1_004409 [Barthelona sp. PCE]